MSGSGSSPRGDVEVTKIQTWGLVVGGVLWLGLAVLAFLGSQRKAPGSRRPTQLRAAGHLAVAAGCISALVSARLAGVCVVLAFGFYISNAVTAWTGERT